MSEKPLHVQVAEALGCKPQLNAGIWMCGCSPGPGPFYPHSSVQGTRGIDRYDTDWSATGPLIERFGIMLHADTSEAAVKEFREENPELFSEEWTSRPIWFQAETPLLAVCRLILALHAAGKLPNP